MTIKSFRDLRVWQVEMDVVQNVYRLTDEFPKHEVFGLMRQMQRAAVSIPSNIAEGHARRHRKEFLQHLAIAHASLAELETQTEIARRLNYISPDKANAILQQTASLGRQLHALRNALMKRKVTVQVGSQPTPDP